MGKLTYHCFVDDVDGMTFTVLSHDESERSDVIHNKFFDHVNEYARQGYRIIALKDGVVVFDKDGKRIVVTINVMGTPT